MLDRNLEPVLKLLDLLCFIRIQRFVSWYRCEIDHKPVFGGASRGGCLRPITSWNIVVRWNKDLLQDNESSMAFVRD